MRQDQTTNYIKSSIQNEILTIKSLNELYEI